MAATPPGNASAVTMARKPVLRAEKPLLIANFPPRDRHDPNSREAENAGTHDEYC